MILKQLMLSDFRNIKEIDLTLSEGCNVISGDNGSGKTSLLEAIYLFWNGRSFRSSRIQDTVNVDGKSVLIRGNAEDDEQVFPFGFQYTKQDKSRLYKFNGETIRRSSDLATLLPVYYFSPQTDNLVSGSAGSRRSLLFWYLFHVEPTFRERFSSLQKAVKQRNQLLRSGGGESEFSFWENQITELSDELRLSTEHRMIALEKQFSLECGEIEDAEYNIESLLNRIKGISAKYSWEAKADLALALSEKRTYEAKLGYTTLGFQKCDFGFDTNYNKRNFSRGEEKTLTLILMISILKTVYFETKKSILFLIDDLSAELDSKFIRLLLDKLASLPLQLFITTLTKDSLFESVSEYFSKFKMFHVKQGGVVEEQNV
ncbi:DNA replication/repair protein RecF [Planctobacterium marinum]|uniref:DNA replication and repair protein RecF n=1 Tax=Planctobacterium marinum TaxID=1631968 RepID=A0AA48HL61_9ALTE|nr:DNA replication and repair protein RecF [Planctobacterium marinum]